MFITFYPVLENFNVVLKKPNEVSKSYKNFKRAVNS